MFRSFALVFAALFPVAAHANGDVTCAEAPFDAPELEPLISAIEPIVERYPGMAPNSVAGTEICLAEGLVGERGYFEVATNRVVVQQGLPRGLLQAVYVHEIRHLQQNEFGICPPLDLSMQEYARAVFALEADASVTSLVVAWDLKLDGETDMWDALAGWPMQQDIARVFADEMSSGGDVATAASLAFDQWFVNDVRRDAYYVSTCMDYLDRQDRENSLPVYGALAPTFFKELCVLPDRTRYDCAVWTGPE